MLLDTPARDPSLDFAPTATALAQVIERSEPRFAIGIFGGWGSGKTTLMDIEARLTPTTSVVVRFNAWRFEREPHILVPMLDAVRDGLATWAVAHQEEPTKANRAREAARRIGRVVRALATGVSAEVGISAAVKVKYDVGKAIDALSQPDEDQLDAEQPQSLYFAGFLELQRAFSAFAEDGATRVVVFVDDLDRCLPANALEVLESMKLFFDLPGFVFVVGLDEQIVERAVRTKLGAGPPTGATDQADAQQRLKLGQEYVKKIFQVPYALPPVPSGSLDDLLESMYIEAKLSPSRSAICAHASDRSWTSSPSRAGSIRARSSASSTPTRCKCLCARLSTGTPCCLYRRWLSAPTGRWPTARSWPTRNSSETRCAGIGPALTRLSRTSGPETQAHRCRRTSFGSFARRRLAPWVRRRTLSRTCSASSRRGARTRA
jgi:hypothetical protein